MPGSRLISSSERIRPTLPSTPAPPLLSSRLTSFRCLEWLDIEHPNSQVGRTSPLEEDTQGWDEDGDCSVASRKERMHRGSVKVSTVLSGWISVFVLGLGPGQFTYR